jgi:hypothetical protein
MDGQTKVVNCTLIHAIPMFHRKHKQWDNYLHIVQHSYKKVVHSSIDHSPFKECYNFQPIMPYEIQVMLPSTLSPHQQKE